MTGYGYYIKSHLTTSDYDVDDRTLINLDSPSPRSQELRDFEAYNRTTLPLLVEANLQAIVESQVAPIEERVRTMVVDIVRTCQSTVARNFHLMVAPALSANVRMQSSTQTAATTEVAGQTYEGSVDPLMDETRRDSLNSFREPPHLNLEASASALGSIYNYSSIAGSWNQSSDSGYPSISFSCSCSCHQSNNIGNTTNGEELSNCSLNLQLTKHEGRSSCQSCDYMHFEFHEFDWNNA